MCTLALQTHRLEILSDFWFDYTHMVKMNYSRQDIHASCSVVDNAFIAYNDDVRTEKIPRILTGSDSRTSRRFFTRNAEFRNENVPYR